MGPASPPPGLPDLEWALVPEAQRFVSKFWQDCNYLQALEGGVDPAHISFLHGILDARDDEGRRALDRAAAGFGFAAQLERTPHIEVADTETGLLIGARRDAPAGQYYWRITQYLLPFHTMPPPEVGSDPLLHTHVWVPIDDDHLVNWCVSWHPTRAITDDERAQFHAGPAFTSPTTRRRPARPTATSGPARAVPTTTSPTGRPSGRGSSSACRAWAPRTRPSPRARPSTIGRSSAWAGRIWASSACAGACSTRPSRCGPRARRHRGSIPPPAASGRPPCSCRRTCRGSRERRSAWWPSCSRRRPARVSLGPHRPTDLPRTPGRRMLQRTSPVRPAQEERDGGLRSHREVAGRRDPHHESPRAAQRAEPPAERRAARRGHPHERRRRGRVHRHHRGREARLLGRRRHPRAARGRSAVHPGGAGRAQRRARAAAATRSAPAPSRPSG